MALDLFAPSNTVPSNEDLLHSPQVDLNEITIIDTEGNSILHHVEDNTTFGELLEDIYKENASNYWLRYQKDASSFDLSLVRVLNRSKILASPHRKFYLKKVN